jgi:DNA-binding HxlR family transcriptional regulator
MSTPVPGKRVRGSTTGRPIMALLDLLGRRATLRILWELRERTLTFRALLDAAATNPSVLNTRLRELRAVGIVETTDDGYRVTREGRELLGHLAPLDLWAKRWARRRRGAVGVDSS